MASCSFRPVNSCRDQPKIRSAAGFIKVTRSSPSETKMASAALSVIAVSRPSCSASCSSTRLRGDVSAEGLERNDLAGVVEKSVDVTQVPAHLMVGSRAAGFLVPLRMLGRERRQLVEKAWPLVLGRELEPALADQLFRLSTVKFGVRPVDEGERRIRQKPADRVRLCLDKRAVSFLALAQRLRRGESGAMQAIEARSIPQQGVCQQRDGGQRDEPNLEVRPVEPGLLSRSEQPSEQYRAGHGNGQQHAGRSGTRHIAGEQGHPARIRAQRQSAQEKDDETDRRV